MRIGQRMAARAEAELAVVREAEGLAAGKVAEDLEVGVVAAVV